MRSQFSGLKLAAALVAGLLLSGGMARAEVAPGDTVTRLNIEKIDGLTSPGVRWAVEQGMDMTVVPYKFIAEPKAYRDATEKYAAQTQLSDDGSLKNWTAGRPFPVIDSNDAKAGNKLMHNFEKTHYFTDDLNVHLPDADTGAFVIDPNGKRHYNVERHFIADWSRRLRYQGRLVHEPIHAIPKNENQTVTQEGFYPLIEPFDLKGVGSIGYRYLDPTRQDDTWLYVPMIRRVRRMSSAQRSDALIGQDIDLDSVGGYSGQIPWFDWKLIGEKPMLGSMHGENLPP